MTPEESSQSTIGIDLRQVALGHAGGLAQLDRGVLRALFALYPEHRFLVFCTIFSRSLVEPLSANVEVRTLAVPSYFEQLGRIATEEGVDVLLRDYPNADELDFPFSRQVFVVPDLQHEVFPEFFPPDVRRIRRLAFVRALACAGAIGTLSEFIRNTITAWPWTRCDDVFLMSPALQIEHSQTSVDDLTPAERALIPRAEFFLYPANLWPHKNHRRVFQAFALFLQKTGRPMAFVCTGYPEGWGSLQAEFADLPIRHLGFVRAELLRVLYARANALVFFSLYEGFGIPLLEAFSADTPVICSSTTSLPEVGGGAVMTCDPTDLEAMSRLMATIVEDKAERARLVAGGRERLGEFSWERSARNLLQALERVASRARTGRDAARRTSWAKGTLPLVSIVTPSLNQARFLGAAIDSALSQSYPRIEYIVIDGGSTDGSVEILKSYGDRLVWISEPDRGQAHALNKGFARAKGEIRAYLNADDILMPRAVERAIAHFQLHPDCDLVYGRAHYIDEEGRVTGTYPTAEYSFARLMEDNCICQPAAFWRSRIGDIVGPFSERLHYALDYDYWLRIDRAGGRIKHIPATMAAWRVYPGIKSRTAHREEIYREIVRVCEEQGGYVGLLWLKGRWHHRIREQTHGWATMLRGLPGAYRIMAKLDYWWRCRRLVRGSSGRTSLARQARRLTSRVPALGRGIDWLAGRVALVHHLWPLYGCGIDNWLGPTCQILVRNRMVGQPLYVSGTAPRDMVLEVRVGRRMLGVHPLKRGEEAKIDFDPAADGARRSVVTLSFSDYVSEGSRRKSFLLSDTNLFSEQDLQRGM